MTFDAMTERRKRGQTVRTTISLPAHIWKQGQESAARHNRKFSNLVSWLIQRDAATKDELKKAPV